ncbi:hypothetical protein RJT34_19163 [Clitoria ternatea]|uniref:Calmodulin-binding protein n=1 Tax=Clitoria ternatea TaxID=43366 RepID=A0AAN9P3A7_CLITE
MASKRTLDKNGEDNDERDLQVRGKRRCGDPEQAEAMPLSFLSNTTNSLDLESQLRKVMKEVLQEMLPPMLQSYITPCSCRQLALNHRGATSGGRAFQLCIMDKLPPTIFTQTNITAQGGGQLQIELLDAVSKERIVREEYSTMKIRICVLHGDFGSDGKEEWTAEEFIAQTVEPRVGKGPLLIGDTDTTLEYGVGFINENILFNDNSSWTRSRKFRLGVQILQPNFIGAYIREGRSEPFKVLDKRGEVSQFVCALVISAYMKHELPSLNDEVWRLAKIAKDGPIHKQLKKLGITTVKKLLQENTINQASLLEKIGNNVRISWDKIIAHAKKCNVDNGERYSYQAPEYPMSLVFNCIYEVVEVKFRGQNSCSLQSLNLEKGLVERVKQLAYKNLKNLVPIETTDNSLNALTSVQVPQYHPQEQDPQQFDLSLAQGPESGSQTETWGMASTSNMVDSDELAWLNYIISIDEFETNLTTNQLEEANSLLLCGDGAECSFNSHKGKSKTLWHKIGNALKLISMAKPFRRYYC